MSKMETNLARKDSRNVEHRVNHHIPIKGGGGVHVSAAVICSHQIHLAHPDIFFSYTTIRVSSVVTTYDTEKNTTSKKKRLRE